MRRALNPAERKQLRYLLERKNDLIDNFIGACDEIANQIVEVKNGNWWKSQLEEEKKVEKNNNIIVVVMILCIISQIVSYVAIDKILSRVMTPAQIHLTVSGNEVLEEVMIPENEAQMPQKPSVEIAVNKSTTEELQAEYEAITNVFQPSGVLTMASGVNYFKGNDGIFHKETYYNLDMSGVVSIMRSIGFTEEEYPYNVRSDGAKCLGDYVMIAANLNLYPRGSFQECSLGQAIVCDTGSFAFANPDQFDIAVNW